MNDVAHWAALIALFCAAGWGVIIVLLHFARPELRPSVAMISEYARPPRGWIMQAAFFCAAAACFALICAAWSVVALTPLVLLALVGLGFAGAGIFVTDPVFIGKGAETRSGRLHLLFAVDVMVLFPIMATTFDAGVGSVPVWAGLHPWLPALSILVWAGLLVFIAASVYSARNDKAPVGYAERFLVLTFTIWLLAMSAAAVFG